MSVSPWDIAKVINTKTGPIEVDKDNYNIFLINKIFSNTQDSVFFANEANAFTKNIPEQIYFDFYYYGLSKASRYGKWHKQPKEDDPEVIEYVQNYFNYSKSKAIEAIECFDEETIINEKISSERLIKIKIKNIMENNYNEREAFCFYRKT